jgi:hypothetical protein
MPLILITTGLIIAWIINTNHKINTSYSIKTAITHYASCIIWFLVPLSSQFIIKAPLFTAHQYIKTIDQGWLELLAGQGTFSTSSNISNTIISIMPKQPTTYLTISSLLLITIISTIIIHYS